MNDLIEALFAFALFAALWLGVMALTIVPWALGLAYMFGWLA